MRKYYVLIFIIPLLQSIYWFGGRNILATGESGLLFANVNNLSEIARNAWTEPALGSASKIGVASYPTYALLAYINTHFLDGYQLQALIFFFLFAVSGTYVFKLTRELIPEIHPNYYLFSVFFYWFNPFAMVNVWNRFLYNYMFFWTLLPVVTYLFIRGIARKDLRYGAYLSIACVVLSYSLTSVIFIALLIFLITVIAILYTLNKPSLLNFMIKYLIIIFATLVLYFAFALSQLFSYLLSSSVRYDLKEFYTTGGNLSTLRSLNTSLGNLGDLYRMKHATFYNSAPQFEYLNNKFISVLEFVFFGLVLRSAVYGIKKSSVLIFFALFLTTIYLSKGSSAPFGEIFVFFFEKIPALQVFRNSYEKFGFILPLSFAPLVGYSLFVNSKTKKLKKTLFAIPILTVGMWSTTFLSRNIFSYWTSNMGKLSYEVSVPESYKEINNLLNHREDDNRMIITPLSDEGITQSWSNRYIGVESSSALFDKSNISFVTSIPYYQNISKAIQNYQLSEKVFSYYPITNAKYLLLRKDVDYKDRKITDPASLETLYDRYENEGKIKKLSTSGQLSVYEYLGEVPGKIYIADTYAYSNSDDLGYIGEYLEPVDAYFLKSNNPIETEYPKLILPTTSYRTRYTYKYKDYSDNNLIGKFFYAKHLPTDPRYLLVLLKENLERMDKSPDELFIYDTGILTKRAYEVFLSKDTESSKRSENNFEKYFNKYTQLYKDRLNSNDKIGLSAIDFLFAIQELHGRYGLSTSDSISSYLIKSQLTPSYRLPDGDYQVFEYDVNYPGEYLISTNLEHDQVYVDGQIGQYKVYLPQGKHEIAILVNEDEEKSASSGASNTQTFKENDQITTIFFSDEPKEYSGSFDYRFISGEAVNLHGFQNVDSVDNPRLSKRIWNSSPLEWRNDEFYFSSTAGAKSMNISLSPIQKLTCTTHLIDNNCENIDKDYQIEIRNFEVLETPKVDAVLVNSESSQRLTETSLDYEMISPSKYVVDVEKLNNDPEIIVFSELFNPDWKAIYPDETELEGHTLVNGFANSWVLDRSGKYKLIIFFVPQESLNKSYVVSGVSLSLTIILLIYLSWRKRK